MKIILVLLALTLAACSPSEEQRTREQARQTGQELKKDAKEVLNKAENGVNKAGKGINDGLDRTRKNVREALDK